MMFVNLCTSGHKWWQHSTD